MALWQNKSVFMPLAQTKSFSLSVGNTEKGLTNLQMVMKYVDDNVYMYI